MRNLYILLILALAIASCSKAIGPETVIAVQPLGKVSEARQDQVRDAISQVYSFRCIGFSPIEMPEECFVKIKSPRYRADKLIRILKQSKPDSVDYVVGITNFDISTTKKGVTDSTHKYFDWGIFGLGYRPGPSCVVSTYRLSHANPSVVSERFKKVCVHEVGHNLGLRHCTSGLPCVMADAVEKISTVDNAPLALCDVCQEKIGIKDPLFERILNANFSALNP